MYLVSVYFDEQTNKVLNRYIDQIARRTGNGFMTEHNVPPHMTVAQIEARNHEVLLPRMEQLRKKVVGGEIDIASVGMMLPYVIYAMPVLNAYLQELAENVNCTFSDIEETRISKYYQPMSWIPHITLGKTLQKEELLEAVSILQDTFVPMKARITEIGLAKVNPHEDIVRFRLKDNL